MLTPEVRRAVYALVASVLVALSVFQLVDDSQSAAILDVVDKLLAAAALVLAYRNVKPVDGA